MHNFFSHFRFVSFRFSFIPLSCLYIIVAGAAALDIVHHNTVPCSDELFLYTKKDNERIKTLWSMFELDNS